MTDVDLILRGGRVIDPSSTLDGVADLAFAAGTLVGVGSDHAAPATARELDCRGLLVVPGLIDLHTHVFPERMEGAIGADVAGVTAGVPTVVDAGSAGSDTIDQFLANEYRAARSRIVVFLNLGRTGLETPPEIRRPDDADIDTAIAAIARHPEHIAGVKVRLVGAGVDALGTDLVRRARAVADSHGLPVMVHVGDPDAPQCSDIAAEAMDLLDPGDILTHVLSGHPGALLSSPEALDRAKAAHDRGVHFDMGHGVRNFSFQAAERLLAEGVRPDTISTDMGKRPRRGPAYSMTETMSKLLLLGLPLPTVIAMATVGPAAALARPDLGRLAVGTVADVTLLREVDGPWLFRDSMGEERTGDRGLIPVGVVREGQVIMADWGPHPTGWLRPAGQERHV